LERRSKHVEAILTATVVVEPTFPKFKMKFHDSNFFEKSENRDATSAI
jgi:hypothetical protein